MSQMQDTTSAKTEAEKERCRVLQGLQAEHAAVRAAARDGLEQVNLFFCFMAIFFVWPGLFFFFFCFVQVLADRSGLELVENGRSLVYLVSVQTGVVAICFSPCLPFLFFCSSLWEDRNATCVVRK